MAAERAAIARYLFEDGPWSGFWSVSCLTAVLREARQLAGRNLDDGDLIADIADANRAEWAAVLMYLILLEQVGRVLRRPGLPATAKRDKNNDLMRALRLWRPAVPQSHADALRALRNALAHNFGLAALDERTPRKGQSAPPGGWHHRRFALSAVGPTVVLPNKRWNGEFGEDARGGFVRVNVRAVGDLVENVVRDIKASPPALRLNLPAPEVLGRFGFRIYGDAK